MGAIAMNLRISSPMNSQLNSSMNPKTLLRNLLPFAPGMLLLLVLLLLPLGVNLFALVNGTYWLISGLLALSLTFIWGVGGIFSFGQTVFFGIAGYSYGIVSVNWNGSIGTVAGLLVGVALAVAFAALLGFLMFYGRVGRLYVAIITLATTLIFYNLFASTSGDQYKVGQAALGGFNGMQRVPTLLDLDVAASYWLVVIVSAVILAGLFWLCRSPFGRVLNAVRVNEERTELLGYDVRQVKLVGFMIGGAIAGLAGVLYTSWGNTISPVVFNMEQATLIVIWAIVGGRSQLWGAFLGAALIQFLSVYLGTTAQKATPLILGAILVAIVLLLPEGIAPALEKLWQRMVPLRSRSAWHSIRLVENPDKPTANHEFDLSEEPKYKDYILLETDNLQRKFGSFCAVDGINLQFQSGQAYCIIGPNGAGKSTFFNLLTGRLKPSSGNILYNGRSITALTPHQRARQGISIKLQVPNIYQELSVYDNLWLAAMIRYPQPQESQMAIAQILQDIGLEHRLNDRASRLSHGEKQWLEIGMAAVTRPQLLLLDEPTGGLSRGETLRTVELLKRLRGYSTIIVIEHDMEFVRQFGADVTVLAQGKVFTTGRIEQVQQDEQVRAIYLGKAYA